MAKLSCAKCGGPMKKLPKAQKGTVVSVTKNGKVIYQEPRNPMDKGDNSDMYKYKSKRRPASSGTQKLLKLKKNQLGGTARIENRIPSGMTGPNKNSVTETMQRGGRVVKAKAGGSLKPVPSDKVGLAKLPTAVRNKMGFQKEGGATKMQKGGMTRKEIKSAIKDSHIAEKAQKTFNKFANAPAGKKGSVANLNMKRLGKKVQRLNTKLKKLNYGSNK